MRPLNPFVVLAFFLALNVLNQIDRNLIASFGPEIVRDLALDRTQFGIVTGLAFTSVYALTALAAGVLADRHGRLRVMAAGLATWSGFTALSGAATGFLSLVAIRPLVATGEATLVPTATALLSERFAAGRRATAIGLFFMGVPLGIGASFLLAGRLGPVLGWRGVFLALGVLGLVLVAGVLAMGRGEARAPRATQGTPVPARALLADLWREVRGNTDLRLGILGTILMHVTLAGGPFVKIWLVEERGLDTNHIATSYGSAVLLFGVIGAGLGGWLADAYAARFRGGRAAFLALVIALLAPFIIAFRLVDPGSWLFQAGMAAGILFFSAFYGPAFAILQSATPARLHASATGLAMLLVNVLALGLGSLLIGAASDALLAAGSHNALTLPLITADAISLLSLFCFARIAWRQWQRPPRPLAA